LALTVAAHLLFVAVFFPYLKVLPLESDTQPYAIMVSALVVLAAGQWRLPWELMLLFIVFAFSLGVAMLGTPGMNAVRSVVNYASLFLISYATYLVTKTHGHLLPAVLKVVVAVWFAVGLVQTAVYPEFLVFLTPRALGSVGFGGRGVVGLSPEPTHYGTFCLLLLVLVFLLKDRQLSAREAWLLAGALMVQMVAFARSSMAVLIFLLCAAAFVVVHMYTVRRAFHLVIGLLVAGGGLAALLGNGVVSLEGARLFTLFEKLLKNPKLLLLVDGSVNDRVFHIVFSVLAFVENLFLPHGYSAWPAYVVEGVRRFSPYAWHVTFTRIMSGYGSALFELGFVGLLIPLVLNVALYRYLRSEPRTFLVLFFALNMMLWTSIPLATPLIGFMLGYMIRQAEQA
jgi:hypothetical protein